MDPPSAPDGTGFGESGSGRGGDNAEQGSAADVPDRDGGGTSAASADMESFLQAFGTEGRCLALNLVPHTPFGPVT